MDIKIAPGTLSGTVRAIPSKSQAQRVLICAALADRPTEVVLKPVLKDVETFMSCLHALGAQIKPGKEGRYRVEPISKKGNKKANGAITLQCGDNAAALRFLLPVAAALREHFTIEGAEGLAGQSLSSMKEAMGAQGCQITGSNLPLTVKGRLKAGAFRLNGDISAQWVSGLILAASAMKNDSEILLTTHLEAEDYVDLTIDVLERYGIAVYEHPDGYKIPGKQNFKAPREIRIEGDWSTAAFWMAANSVGNKVNCEGLNQKSVQGDRKIGALLQNLGGDAIIDCTHIPDLVPPLAVVAAVSRGTTRFENANRLRLKETDRLAALVKTLVAIGAEVIEFEDGFTVTGKEKLTGGEVDAYGDHRMVMALAIAATVCQGDLIIRGAEAVERPYPGFFNDYEKLGGKITVI